jgi:predicted aspartyl protease
MGSEDKRAALHWDTSQTIANCKINGSATLAIVDSGSYKTIMDTAMAKILGLRVR